MLPNMSYDNRWKDDSLSSPTMFNTAYESIIWMRYDHFGEGGQTVIVFENFRVTR